MTNRTGSVAFILLFSGFAALVYQTVWMREFRLIFGSSTAATAAVLAIFMGGLGLGSAILGRRADSVANPLRFYAQLELGIAALAAVSPLLISGAAHLYFATGGSPRLGTTGASLVRMILSILVIGAPTFLMGGTLPAAAKAVVPAADVSRRRLAMLYGTNTFGAVLGVLLTTFVLLETLGNRATLHTAALVNAAAAAVALWLSARSGGAAASAGESARPETTSTNGTVSPSAFPRPFILLSAAIVGFVFLLMELVWYRMLTPILGGTTFTFGLILASALAGIAIGGAAYGTLHRDRQATLAGFAMTAALEAMLMALPFALGDMLAVAALQLRSFSVFGFGGTVFGWSMITLIAVVPGSIIAGYQFPLLISLLGRGREGIGDDTGRAYAWNTWGAIAGSLAGGFGILPLLTATGSWMLCIALLALLSVASLLLVRPLRWQSWAVPGSIALMALLMLTAAGPTAAWRHSAIGAGRARVGENENSLRAWKAFHRRVLIWSSEGVESSVGVTAGNGYSFVINGKVDGNARGDAGTQVMGGLLGPLLHGSPRTAMVVGLGTGSSAGWLGRVPGIERVDVAELEPAVIEVARLCDAVNAGVLDNPKVNVILGDAREVLLTGDDAYDVIISEPSNPYRAGIAGLLTRDFYQAVAHRLTDDGLFVQWLQAYEVDAPTVGSVYASFTSVFSHVETWGSTSGDLLLVGATKPLRHDTEALTKRLRTEPYLSALKNVWLVTDKEGVFAHYIAGTRTAQAVAGFGDVNTDDRTIIEFGFARALGKDFFRADQLYRLAQSLGDDLPMAVEGELDADVVNRRRLSSPFSASGELSVPRRGPQALEHKQQIVAKYMRGEYEGLASSWTGLGQPTDLSEGLMLADGLASAGDARTMLLIDELRPILPVEAAVIHARYLLAENRPIEASESLASAFVMLRTNPWPQMIMVDRAFSLAERTGGMNDQAAARLYESLGKTLSAAVQESKRLDLRLKLASRLEPDQCGPRTLAAFEIMEPFPVWKLPYLRQRAGCYAATGHNLENRAAQDLRTYLENERPSLLALASSAGLIDPATNADSEESQPADTSQSIGGAPTSAQAAPNPSSNR